MIYCESCMQRKPASKSDPEFCQGCFNRIERMVQNPMPHVRAAVALINGSPNTQQTEDMKMFAFLSIFHPKMTHQRKRQIVDGRK